MSKNNPFEPFNINYLSPSSINAFINNLPHWILTYVYKFKDPFGNPAFWRGMSAEDGICYALKKPSATVTKAYEIALRKFESERKAFLKQSKTQYKIIEPKIAKEKKDLQSYVVTGVPYFRGLEIKDATFQDKIKLEIEGCPIPIIGYTDIQYGEIVRDIKTSNRMPSEISDSYARQLSVYAHATKKNSAIIDYVYVTSREAKVVSKPVNDLEKYMDQTRTAVFNMMNLLSKAEDINELVSMVFPDFDDWKWSANQKAEARKLWGIK